MSALILVFLAVVGFVTCAAGGIFIATLLVNRATSYWLERNGGLFELLRMYREVKAAQKENP